MENSNEKIICRRGKYYEAKPRHPYQPSERARGRPAGGVVVFDLDSVRALPDKMSMKGLARLLKIAPRAVTQWVLAKNNPLPHRHSMKKNKPHGIREINREVFEVWLRQTGRLK